MEPTITKFDENSLQLEEAVIQTQTISLEEIEAQLAQILASKSVLDGHLAYYQNLKAEAVKFALKTKEEIEAAKPKEEEVAIEEVIVEEEIVNG